MRFCPHIEPSAELMSHFAKCRATACGDGNIPTVTSQGTVCGRSARTDLCRGAASNGRSYRDSKFLLPSCLMPYALCLMTVTVTVTRPSDEAMQHRSRLPIRPRHRKKGTWLTLLRCLPLRLDVQRPGAPFNFDTLYASF